MRNRLRFGKLLAATLVLGGGLALALGLSWASSSGSAAPVAASSLTCSVKGSCGGDEVAVFRLSSTANAHGGTAGGSGYGNVVCCGSVADLGLATNCSGTYDTVLALSGSDNAHAATTVGGSYTTEVCLSAGAGETVGCTYDDTCGGDYACLATISGSTNAHVADCGIDGYTTKVCCAVTGGGAPVGGVAQLPDASGPSGPNYLALAGLAAALLVALSAGGWYARRRWLR
jgi:hypothetical protein